MSEIPGLVTIYIAEIVHADRSSIGAQIEYRTHQTQCLQVEYVATSISQNDTQIRFSDFC